MPACTMPSRLRPRRPVKRNSFRGRLVPVAWVNHLRPRRRSSSLSHSKSDNRCRRTGAVDRSPFLAPGQSAWMGGSKRAEMADETTAGRAPCSGLTFPKALTSTSSALLDLITIITFPFPRSSVVAVAAVADRHRGLVRLRGAPQRRMPIYPRKSKAQRGIQPRATARCRVLLLHEGASPMPL